MNTTHFVNPHGVTIFRTRMTVKGEDILVSTSGELVEHPDEDYWETVVFHPGDDGEPDFDQEDLGRERHYLRDNDARFSFDKFGITDDLAKMEKIHQAMVAALTLLDRGIVFSHENSVADIVYAIAYNDFSQLK